MSLLGFTGKSFLTLFSVLAGAAGGLSIFLCYALAYTLTNGLIPR